MKNKFLSAAACILAVFFMASLANAAQFSGQLSLTGQSNFTATSITFQNPAGIGGSSGDLAALGTCPSCVTMIGGILSTDTNVLVYTAVNNGKTSTFTVANPTFSMTTSNGIDSLTITGTGTATLTGFDPTPGAITITAQGQAGVTNTTFTFSSSTFVNPVPEPASMLLLGTGLTTLAGVLRRRMNGLR